MTIRTGIVGVVACVTAFAVVPHAGAQRATADAALLRCGKMAARQWTSLFTGTPKDSAEEVERTRREEAYRDSVKGAARGCLASVPVNAVSDSLLDSLATVQWRVGEEVAAAATARRLMGSSLPVAQRVQGAGWVVQFLKPTPEVLGLWSALIPMTDSLHNAAASAKIRLDAAWMTRLLDSLGAYLPMQELARYLGTLDSAGLVVAMPIAVRAVDALGWWGVTDNTAQESLGLAGSIIALYPKSREMLDPLALNAKRLTRIGRQAGPVQSKFWLNAPGTTERNFASGRVTVMEFTEFWCTGCKLSYKPLQKMSVELAPAGLDVLFVVPNQSGHDNGVTQAGEATVAKYRTMFAPYGITFPVMVAETKDYHEWYAVYAIPHFVLIDRHGKIRDVFLGWNGDRMTRRVRELLAES